MPKDPKDEKTPAAPAAEAPEPAGKKEKPEKSEKGEKAEKGGKGKEGKPAKGAKSGAPGTESKAKKFVPDNPDFRYIVRLAGSDLDGTRPTVLALTGVRGIGPRIAEVACRMAGVKASERIGNLPEATVDGIEETLNQLAVKLPTWMVNHPSDYATGENHHYFGPDLETSRRDDINQQRMVRSYKGVRHERGQKVRGQRTRSNGRTGMAAGVLKKQAKEAAAAKSAEAGGAEAEKKEKKPAAAATPAGAA